MIMKTTHTPGPWVVKDRACFGHSLSIDAGKWEIGRALAFNYKDDEQAANAKLMAAAPCLLEACKAALSQITDDGRQGGTDWTIKTLKSAIAKAEGNA